MLHVFRNVNELDNRVLSEEKLTFGGKSLRGLQFSFPSLRGPTLEKGEELSCPCQESSWDKGSHYCGGGQDATCNHQIKIVQSDRND